MTTLQDLLTVHAGIAYERQLFLADLIEGYGGFSLDLQAGHLTFGDELTMNVQVLGNQTEQTQTWLWGWADEASRFPAALLRRAGQLRTYGREQGVHALIEPEIGLDETHHGHRFAMVASGLLDLNAYYRIPYEGGALFVLIDDPSFPQDTRQPIRRISLVFPPLISHVALPDHRAALRCYGAAHGLTIAEDRPDFLRITDDSEQDVRGTFDEQHRLIDLSVRMNNP